MACTVAGRMAVGGGFGGVRRCLCEDSLAHCRVELLGLSDFVV